MQARNAGRVNVFKGFGLGKADVHRSVFGTRQVLRKSSYSFELYIHINITKSCCVLRVQRRESLHEVRVEVLSCPMSDHHRPPPQHG